MSARVMLHVHARWIVLLFRFCVPFYAVASWEILCDLRERFVSVAVGSLMCCGPNVHAIHLWCVCGGEPTLQTLLTRPMHCPLHTFYKVMRHVQSILVRLRIAAKVHVLYHCSLLSKDVEANVSWTYMCVLSKHSTHRWWQQHMCCGYLHIL